MQNLFNLSSSMHHPSVLFNHDLLLLNSIFFIWPGYYELDIDFNKISVYCLCFFFAEVTHALHNNVFDLERLNENFLVCMFPFDLHLTPLSWLN